MSQWHYHTEEYTLAQLENPDYLNALGEQGYELVWLQKLGVSPIKYLVVFKKQFVQSKKL